MGVLKEQLKLLYIISLPAKQSALILWIEKYGEESFYLKLRGKEGTELASLSSFSIGELTVITDTTGYLTITTYSQPADDNCYLYHYRYSDNVVVLTPVNYDTGFIFSTLAADDDNTIILHIGKTGEDERYSLHFVK